MRAQLAEKKHYYKLLQQPSPWSIDVAREYLSSNFNIDIAFFSHKKVLEVGAGAGLINFIRDASCFRVGIDPLIKLFKDRIDPDVQFCKAIGERLPFRDDVFDIILCINVLDHCISPLNVLEEIKRCLKKGGLLVLSVNTFLIPKAVRLLASLDEPHPYHFSPKELSALVKKCGFKVQFKLRRRPSLRKWKNLIGFLCFGFMIDHILARKEQG
jgi:SAM-dependent methyltransferase